MSMPVIEIISIIIHHDITMVVSVIVMICCVRCVLWLYVIVYGVLSDAFTAFGEVLHLCDDVLTFCVCNHLKHILYYCLAFNLYG